MNDKAKEIAIQKLDEIITELQGIKQKANADYSADEIVEKLRETWRSIFDLKALVKAFAITDMINHGRHDEAAEAVGKPY